VALAGTVAAIRRKKKSASSFLPHRSGMADRAGHWARQGGLNRWAMVPFLPHSFFFYSYSFPIFCFTVLDSNLNSNLFCRFELRSSSKTYPGYALA
jgi:hypothetical protein